MLLIEFGGEIVMQRSEIACRLLGLALVLTLTGCVSSTGPSFEYIHLPGTEPAAGANMPFTSAIGVGTGRIVFLSGITGAPVPHSHPHIPAEFDHVNFDPEAQAIEVMERLKETVEAAGGTMQDIVKVTRYVRDIGANQDVINAVMNRYWGPNHRPASTSVEIVRLATDPRFILEVDAIAVLP